MVVTVVMPMFVVGLGAMSEASEYRMFAHRLRGRFSPVVSTVVSTERVVEVLVAGLVAAEQHVTVADRAERVVDAT